jgi:hypothetical protein
VPTDVSNLLNVGRRCLTGSQNTTQEHPRNDEIVSAREPIVFQNSDEQAEDFHPYLSHASIVFIHFCLSNARAAESWQTTVEQVIDMT